MNENEDTDTLDGMGEYPVENIGTRIRRVRKELKLTAAQLAAPLGVERAAVTNWERGRRPSLENLYQISKKTNVPMEWFMAGPDDLPIPFLDAAAEVMRIASEPSLTLSEAESIMTLTLLGLGESSSEAQAQIAARALIRAYRKPPAAPGIALSEEDKRSAVIEAIRLFRSE